MEVKGGDMSSMEARKGEYGEEGGRRRRWGEREVSSMVARKGEYGEEGGRREGGGGGGVRERCLVW